MELLAESNANEGSDSWSNCIVSFGELKNIRNIKNLEHENTYFMFYIEYIVIGCSGES